MEAALSPQKEVLQEMLVFPLANLWTPLHKNKTRIPERSLLFECWQGDSFFVCVVQFLMTQAMRECSLVKIKSLRTGWGGLPGPSLARGPAASKEGSWRQSREAPRVWFVCLL